MDSYNCSGADNSAYGAGNFGTCDGQPGQTITGAPGAPNTGFLMQELAASPAGIILIPLLAAIVIAVIATVIVKLRKRLAK